MQIIEVLQLPACDHCTVICVLHPVGGAWYYWVYAVKCYKCTTWIIAQLWETGLCNMLKTINHIEATRGPQGKHLKFPIATDTKGPYKHHLVVRVDTGADVNCMNEKTFNELFPEVELSVCPHEIQNFRNSIADISILGQFHTYLEFRGEKYLNTFIVTNVNDCPNLLSYGATFRMGVILPNYPEENIVKGENVPNFKVNTGTSNVFQILQDL